MKTNDSEWFGFVTWTLPLGISSKGTGRKGLDTGLYHLALGSVPMSGECLLCCLGGVWSRRFQLV